MSDSHEEIGRIKMRPYLAQYVRRRENLVPAQPLIVPGCSPIALALDICLTNKTTYLAAKKGRLRSEFTETLTYRVSGARARSGFIFVSDALTSRFNAFVLHALHDDLADRIFRAAAAAPPTNWRGSEKETILAFMSEHGMEDLVEYDALKKANYRLRTHRGYAHERGRSWTYSPTAGRFISREDGHAPFLLVPSTAQLRLAL